MQNLWDQGQITLDGLTLADNQADYRKKIGFIPETPSLYEELTLRELLRKPRRKEHL